MDTLKIIFDKLSQYHFLTNILPGSVLCIVLKYLIGFNLMPDNIYGAGIVFYFVGMVNGRVGSLVVEKVLQKTKFVKFVPYKDFIVAEKLDPKITTLSQENNTYRAYISVFLISIVFWAYRLLTDAPDMFQTIGISILLLAMLVIFAFSYQKQTNYVRSRIENNLKEHR